MQGANIFLSDKIRIHALDFTPDGLGMASQPFVVLDPDASPRQFLWQALSQPTFFGLLTLDTGWQIGLSLIIKALKKGYARRCSAKPLISVLIINELPSAI